MKLKYTFEQIEIDGQIMAVPVGDKAADLHAMLKLNESAAEIMTLLKEDTTEDKICQVLSDKYEGDKEEIAKYVHKYCEKLMEVGVLE